MQIILFNPVAVRVQSEVRSQSFQTSSIPLRKGHLLRRVHFCLYRIGLMMLQSKMGTLELIGAIALFGLGLFDIIMSFIVNYC